MAETPDVLRLELCKRDVVSHRKVLNMFDLKLCRRWLTVMALVVCVTTGCSSLFVRSKSSLLTADGETESGVTLVSHVAHPYGLGYIKLEAVSMATGLAGTGEDPPPSPQRASLMDEMKRREVENPQEILASPETALVLVRGFLRPGIQ